MDILVDLTGHTEGDHFAILNHRPAPVQVNWLGYPGTDGAPSLDYILADTVVAPPGHEPFFSEKIVRLPDCYFPTAYDPAPAAPSRAEAGLPESRFRLRQLQQCLEDHAARLRRLAAAAERRARQCAVAAGCQ